MESRPPQKKARIRIPKHLDDFATATLLRAVGSPCRPKGSWEISILEECTGYLTFENVLYISGDHHVVEPLIAAVMEVIHGTDE